VHPIAISTDPRVLSRMGTYQDRYRRRLPIDLFSKSLGRLWGVIGAGTRNQAHGTAKLSPV